MRYLPIFVALGLTIYAAIDCLRTPEEEVKHLPKPAWLVIVLLVWVVGPIIWLLTGRGRDNAPRPPAPRPLAPDDDPEFLRRLNEDRLLRSWEENRKKGDDGASDQQA